MKFRHIKHRLNTSQLVLIVWCIFLLGSCGDNNSPSGDSASDSGTLSFKIAYHGATNDPQLKAATIDCVGQGVATVQADVYDPDNALLASGGPWNCDAGQGSISAVPAGSGRTVGVWGKNTDGKVVFSGQKSNIDVVAGKENKAGSIECFAFVPNLQAPDNGSEIEASVMVLEWAEVSGAAEYGIIVSHNSDLSDPIIEQATSTTNLTPTGLSYRKTCYWQVYAIDAYGNSGIGSDIWSFRSPGNVSPFAQINCPSNGIIYTEGDTIDFTGSGSDINDGDLSGESLVWSSDLYGQIGTGQTCSSELLGAGIHQISVTATDSDGLSWADTVTIAVNAGSAVGSLPDTGQSTSHTDTAGEDSDYTINPPAYTKLDASGNELDACATEWAMVRDDVTGLIWEVKTDDGSIHDKDDKYVLVKNQRNDLDAYEDFIRILNEEEFGGESDWRLPTIKELYTIVHKDNLMPAINVAYFPNTMPDWYWSSTSYALNTKYNTNYEWGVYFGDGQIFFNNDGSHDKSNSFYVRAVRGEKVSNNFVDNENTVTDRTTGLMWQKFQVADVDGNVRTMSWEEALEYCETLELADFDDWRLPNINELQTLVEYVKDSHPVIDTTFFTNAMSSRLWSATTSANHTDHAWQVCFGYGHVDIRNKSISDSYSVRAVRNAK